MSRSTTSTERYSSARPTKALSSLHLVDRTIRTVILDMRDVADGVRSSMVHKSLEANPLKSYLSRDLLFRVALLQFQ